MHVDVRVEALRQVEADPHVLTLVVDSVVSQCGIPPTTDAPLSIAAAISSAVPGSRRMPSCGNAMTCTSAMSAQSAAAASTPSSGTSPPIVSTSTCERSRVVPVSTDDSMTARARRRTSSTV